MLKHIFEKKFRESTVFTKEVTKELISRNIFSAGENFAFFHTVTVGKKAKLSQRKNIT